MKKRRIAGIVFVAVTILSVLGYASYDVGQTGIELHGFNPAFAYALFPLIITGLISVGVFLFWCLKEKSGGKDNGS